VSLSVLLTKWPSKPPKPAPLPARPAFMSSRTTPTRCASIVLPTVTSNIRINVSVIVPPAPSSTPPPPGKCQGPSESVLPAAPTV
jgi:hypothetical protein